jgi:hypothetical protein
MRRGLVKLAGLAQENFRELLSVLSRPPTAVRRREYPSSVAASLPALPAENVEEIVTSLLFLLGYRQSQNVDEFAASVAENMQHARQEVAVAPAASDLLRLRLVEALRVESLRLRTKAVELMFEGAQVFQAARIVTDFRPVFGGEAGLDIMGGLVVHNLKLEYFTVDGTGEMYLSMDDDDILQLKQVLNRAEQKARVLRKHLKNSQIVDLNLGGPGDNDQHA